MRRRSERSATTTCFPSAAQEEASDATIRATIYYVSSMAVTAADTLPGEFPGTAPRRYTDDSPHVKVSLGCPPRQRRQGERRA